MEIPPENVYKNCPLHGDLFVLACHPRVRPRRVVFRARYRRRVVVGELRAQGNISFHRHFQRLFYISNQIFWILDTDREPNQIGPNA